MPEFLPKARENLERSLHPDLQRAEDGSLAFRADVDLPRSERDFRRMWEDEAERSAFLRRLDRQQRQLPEDVQRQVAGREFGDPRDPWHGYLTYLATIQDERSLSPGEITGADVEAMTLEQFDAAFDASGRPKPGVTYSPGSRDVDVLHRGRAGGIDPHSAREMRNNRS